MDSITIQNLISKNSKYRTFSTLFYTKTLLEYLDNPQDELKFIHVTGTNGKGSTCAIISKILEEANYKCALFISPWVYEFNERFSINSKNISDEKLTFYYEKVLKAVKKCERHGFIITEFDIITAIAFCYFRDEKCDFVVLEAGVGVLYDSTNIIKSTILSAITSINLDHSQYLGDTIEKIAENKAAIMRKSKITIYNDKIDKKAKNALFKQAKIYDAILTDNNVDLRSILHKNDGIDFVYQNELMHLSLTGLYQEQNLKTALKAIEILMNTGVNITLSQIKNALKNVYLPARFQKLSENPTFIIDGAHNEEAIFSVINSAKNAYPNKKICALYTAVKDKNFADCLNLLHTHCDKVLLYELNDLRAVSLSDLAKILPKAHAFLDVTSAIKFAKENYSDYVIIALGSFYASFDVKKAFFDSL